MAFSTQVSDGQDTLAIQYNNLRLDVLDPTSGHDHDGTAGHGQKVDHGNLVDGAIASTYLTHAMLNKHVQGVGTSADPDATGGEQGAHGLGAGEYFVGSFAELIVQGGTDALSSGTKAVTFSTPFPGTLVSVTVTMKGAPGGTDHYPSDPYITSATVAGFTVSNMPSRDTWASSQFYWMAVGT